MKISRYVLCITKRLKNIKRSTQRCVTCCSSALSLNSIHSRHSKTHQCHLFTNYLHTQTALKLWMSLKNQQPEGLAGAFSSSFCIQSPACWMINFFKSLFDGSTQCGVWCLQDHVARGGSEKKRLLSPLQLINSGKRSTESVHESSM